MRVFKTAYLLSYVFLLAFIPFVSLGMSVSKPELTFAQDINCPTVDENMNCASFDKTYQDQLPGGFQFPTSSGNPGDPNYGFKGITNELITVGGSIIGGIAVLKIIFGGVLYATAAGNPKMLGEAKSHIYYALIGIALLVGMNIVLFLIGADY